MSAYSIDYQAPYGDGTRNRGLAVAGVVFFVKAILLIPHAIILMFVYLAATIAAYVGYWAVALTGTLPEGIFNFVRGAIAWYNRTTVWLYGVNDEYPPFALEAPDYPSQMTVEYGDGTRSRGLAVAGIFFFFKAILALPHLVIVSVLGYAAGIAAYVGFWIVAITGRLPEGLHTFFVGVIRWNTRTIAWIAGLEDTYPPFGME